MIPKEEELEEIDMLRQRFVDAVLPFVRVQRRKDTDVRTRTLSLYSLIESLGIQKRLAEMEEEFRRDGNEVLAKEYHQIRRNDHGSF